MKKSKPASSDRATASAEIQFTSYDLSTLDLRMNLYVLGLIVADLKRVAGAHVQYDEDEIMGLAHFLRDTLPADVTAPAVPRRAVVLVRPA